MDAVVVPEELHGEITVRTALAVHEQMSLVLRQNDAVLLDLSGVTECDLTAVQILEGARRSADRDGKRFGLAAPASGSLLDVLLRAGLLSSSGADASGFWLQGGNVAP